MKIKSILEADALIQKTCQTALSTYQKIQTDSTSLPALDFLSKLKFEKYGVDPITQEPLNFIEQLNQMFSNLVVFQGVKHLLLLHPDKEFEVHLGPTSGFDIESDDSSVVAECFAVTTATSNQKLKKDCLKLLSCACDKDKHIFFFSENDSDVTLQKIYEKYPTIFFKRLSSPYN